MRFLTLTLFALIWGNPTWANDACVPLDGAYTIHGASLDQAEWLYSKPRFNSDVVGHLPPNATGVHLERLRNLKRWCQVRWGCVSGLVKCVYVSGPGFGDASVPARPNRVKLKAASLVGHDLRAGTSWDMPVVATLPEDATVISVHMCANGESDEIWCAIQAGNATGWMAFPAPPIDPDHRRPTD